MKKWGIILIVGVAVVIFVQVIVLAVLLASDEPLFASASSVVVIDINDVIMDSKPVLDRIDLYQDRDDVKAIVLRMETPGGSVAASQELSSAVRRLRDSGKTVVTSVGNLGASGGYYIASQCDAIVVNPGSLVGSIGVVMEHFEISELTAKLGIKMEAIASGDMKTAGSISRPMRPDERRMLEALIADAFSQFRTAVLEGRSSAIAASAGLATDDTDAIGRALDAVSDGRILTGAQAVRVGLADELGDLRDAIRVAGELAGIKEPNVIYDKPEEPWEKLSDIFGMARAFTSRSPLSILPPSGLWYIYR